MSIVVVIIVIALEVSLIAATLAGWLRDRLRAELHGSLNDLVEFVLIEPHPSTGAAIVDFDPLSIGHGEFDDFALWAAHANRNRKPGALVSWDKARVLYLDLGTTLGLCHLLLGRRSFEFFSSETSGGPRLKKRDGSSKLVEVAGKFFLLVERLKS